MKKVKYICSHCGRRFEAEEREIVECPGCFWSTSVGKDDGSVKTASAPAPQAARGNQEGAKFAPINISFPSLPLKPLAVLLLIASLAAALYFFNLPARLAGLLPKKSISVRGPVETSPAQPGVAESAAPPAAPSQGFSQEDTAVLERDISAQITGELSPPEKTSLEREASLTTGLVERLPAAAWTRQTYESMITEQEKNFKISLPRSYRKKLIELFEAEYLPAAQAFEQSRLLEARDGWVRSLAFPLYSEDLRKHRGVALTMLRPFINDTLSKVGVLNNLLREKALRGMEEGLNQRYAQFRQNLLEQKWDIAIDLGKALEAELVSYEQKAFSADGPPPYPAEIAKVDQDIGFTLSELLKAPDPTVADVGGMLQDVRIKNQIADARASGGMDGQISLYKSALDLIKTGNQSQAAEELRKIQSPPALVQDSREKLQVLGKTQANA